MTAATAKARVRHRDMSKPKFVKAKFVSPHAVAPRRKQVETFSALGARRVGSVGNTRAVAGNKLMASKAEAKEKTAWGAMQDRVAVEEAKREEYDAAMEKELLRKARLMTEAKAEERERKALALAKEWKADDERRREHRAAAGVNLPPISDLFSELDAEELEWKMREAAIAAKLAASDAKQASVQREVSMSKDAVRASLVQMSNARAAD